MEVLTERLNKGTLQHLQKLEQQANEISREGQSRVKQEKMLRALQKAVHQLQERRDVLNVQIANSPNKVLGPILKTTQQDNPESLSAAIQEAIQTPADKKTLKNAVKEATQLKQRELSVSYRLTGCTVHKTDNNGIRVRWDTFDLGEYFLPYYAMLSLKPDGSLHLLKHNLPYFLPTKELVSEHLNSNLQGFVQAVGDHLNGFVSRQQQVVEAREERSRNIQGEIISSNAFNNISLTLSSKRLVTKSVDVQLVYDDLQESRPTRVVLQSNSGAFTREQLGVMRDVFMRQRIADAIAEVFKQ